MYECNISLFACELVRACRQDSQSPQNRRCPETDSQRELATLHTAVCAGYLDLNMSTMLTCTAKCGKEGVCNQTEICYMQLTRRSTSYGADGDHPIVIARNRNIFVSALELTKKLVVGSKAGQKRGGFVTGLHFRTKGQPSIIKTFWEASEPRDCQRPDALESWKEKKPQSGGEMQISALEVSSSCRKVERRYSSGQSHLAGSSGNVVLLSLFA